MKHIISKTVLIMSVAVAGWIWNGEIMPNRAIWLPRRRRESVARRHRSAMPVWPDAQPSG